MFTRVVVDYDSFDFVCTIELMLFLSGILSMLFFVGFSKPHTTRHHHYPCAFVDVFE